MKRTKQKLAIYCLLPTVYWLLFTAYCFSQDIIIKKNRDVIKAKILEIGTDEIKFKYYDAPDGPIIIMKKEEIQTMKLEGKSEQIIEVQEDPRSISNKAILDKGSSLKFHFFSPLNNHLAFSYEWMNKPGFNWEVGLGIIGPGVGGLMDNLFKREPQGFFLRGGPKFLLGSSSDIEIEGAKYAHPLKGRFFKIEMLLNALSSTYTVDTGSYYYTPNGGFTTSGSMKYKNTYQSVAFHVIYGRQYIFGNSITVGWHLGVGYGFESKTTTKPSNTSYLADLIDTKRYSHRYFGKNFPLTTTWGFTVGYILKTPDWLSRPSVTDFDKRPSRHYKKGAQMK